MLAGGRGGVAVAGDAEGPAAVGRGQASSLRRMPRGLYLHVFHARTRSHQAPRHRSWGNGTAAGALPSPRVPRRLRRRFMTCSIFILFCR